MNDFERMQARRDLEAHAAKAAGLLLTDGSAAVDAYLEQVGYQPMLDAYRAAGGLP